MTSYSTYMSGSMRLVDGSLHFYDEEIYAEQIDQVINCLAAGAARALLDCARDDAPGQEDAEVDAVQWHSPQEGWELEAIVPGDLPKLMDVVGRFARANSQRILDLGARIAWSEKTRDDTFHGDTGMGLYRVGMLMGYMMRGAGVGFNDYHDPTIIDGVVYGDIIVDQLNDGAREEKVVHAFENVWIDSTEEPCLLHLSA